MSLDGSTYLTEHGMEEKKNVNFDIFPNLDKLAFPLCIHRFILDAYVRHPSSFYSESAVYRIDDVYVRTS